MTAQEKSNLKLSTTSTHMKMIRLLSVVVALCMMTPVARAQGTSNPTVVTLVDALLSGAARVEVQTRTRQFPHNIILVDPRATPSDLASAIALMNALRSKVGDYPTKDLKAQPASFTPAAGWNDTHRPRFEQQLQELRSAEVRAIQGVGSQRALDITVVSGGKK